MQLILALTVTLSFLAGQACGNGVRVFHPQEAEQEGEVMSRVVVRCDMVAQEGIAGTSADCGPGRCIEGVKDEPDDVSSARSGDVSCPPEAVGMHRRPAPLLVAQVLTRRTPEPSRPILVVRRE